MSDDDYVKTDEICNDVFFGITPVWLWKLRQHPKFPKPIGARPMYFSKSKVIAWRDKYWNSRELAS
mgnify:FL=1